MNYTFWNGAIWVDVASWRRWKGFTSSPSYNCQVIPWLDVFGGKFRDIPTISKGREILELDVTSKFALNACFIVDSDDMKLFCEQFSSPVE